MDRRADLALAVAVVGFGGVLFVLTSQLEPGVYFDPVGKQGLPYIVSGALVASGLVLVARRLAAWARDPSDLVYAEGAEDEAGQPASVRQAGAVMVLTLGYVVIWTPLGYLIATPIYLVSALLVMGVRSISVLAVAALSYTIITFLVFSQLLGVRLPLGPLSELLSSAALTAVWKHV